MNLSSNVKLLERGEISIKTTIIGTEAENMEYNSEMYVPATVAYASLDFQNRRDLIPDDVRWPTYLTDNDLYYNPELRNRVYTELGLDPNKSYYQLAKEMGVDLARFY